MITNNIKPVIDFNKDKKDTADFFCNCPNCKNIVGKITYGYKYDGGIALGQALAVCYNSL